MASRVTAACAAHLGLQRGASGLPTLDGHARALGAAPALVFPRGVGGWRVLHRPPLPPPPLHACPAYQYRFHFNSVVGSEQIT